MIKPIGRNAAELNNTLLFELAVLHIRQCVK